MSTQRLDDDAIGPAAADPAAPDPAAALLRDADLIAGVLAGTTYWYGHLVRRHQDSLYRVAWSMVGDPDVAVDLVQDAFIRAYSNLGRCREPEQFRAWAMAMLRNRCLDHLKERRRQDIPLADVEDVYDNRGADTLDVLSVRGELQRALHLLPDTLREAFLLRHVEDLAYEEMAEVLDTSVAGVKMRVSRARDLLRRHLQSSRPAAGGDPAAGAGTREGTSEDVTTPHPGSSDG